MRLVLILLLFVAIILNLLMPYYSPPRSRQVSYDHIQMVMSWPPTYCISVKCKAQLRQNFYLHGLWPADSNGRTLTNCKGTTISDPQSLLSQLGTARISLLDTYWPSVRDEKKTKRGTFWLNEWNKHGTCSENEFKVEAYFDKGIERISNLFELLGVLAAAHITPSHTQPYRRGDIVQAIQGVIGQNMNIYISCWRVKKLDLLHKIHICLDNTQATGYVSCPVDTDPRGCRPGRDIIIPPF